MYEERDKRRTASKACPLTIKPLGCIDDELLTVITQMCTFLQLAFMGKNILGKVIRSQFGITVFCEKKS